ncbi:MAG: hypothetical protein ACYC0V_18410 [Armatimonadota bacterium]
MNLTICEEEWAFRGWSFEFRQRVTYGAWAQNCVIVEVNPSNGSIESYFSLHTDSPSPKRPQITSTQSINLAKKATGIVTVQTLDGPDLIVEPAGDVSWTMEIAGLNARGDYDIHVVDLNAETGKIIARYDSE